MKQLPQLETIQHVVWLQTAFLGDIILTTAAMSLIAKRFPSWKQHLITTHVGAKALEQHPCISQILVFDKKKSTRQEFSRIKSHLPHANTLLLQPHKSFRSSLLRSYLKFPSITYAETSLGCSATVQISRVAVLHEAHRIALLLEPLGISREEILASRPFFPVEKNPSIPAWQNFLQNRTRKKIGIAPGSVWGTKRWPIESFCTLSRRLAEHGFNLVLLGAKEEQPLAAQMLEAVGPRSDQVLNTAGITSFLDLRWIFPQLDLVISNDSAPIHYASACNVPTLALFGATVSAMGFGPLAERSQVVEVEGLPCRPCGDHGPQICPLTHFRCMRDLSVDRIYNAALAMLMAI